MTSEPAGQNGPQPRPDGGVTDGGVTDGGVTAGGMTEESMTDEVAQTPTTAALAALDEVAARPLAEHPDVYQRIYADLHGALSSIDDA